MGLAASAHVFRKCDERDISINRSIVLRLQEYEDTINLTRHDFENHLENTSNTIDKILNSIQTFILEKYGSLFIAS